MNNVNNEYFKKISQKLEDYVNFSKDEHTKKTDFINANNALTPEKRLEKTRKIDEIFEKKVSSAKAMRQAALGAEPDRLDRANSFFSPSNQVHTISTSHMENLTDYFNGGTWN